MNDDLFSTKELYEHAYKRYRLMLITLGLNFFCMLIYSAIAIFDCINNRSIFKLSCDIVCAVIWLVVMIINHITASINKNELNKYKIDEDDNSIIN